MMQTYRITTHDEEFNTRKTLGYATGEVEAIRKYFAPMTYGKVFIDQIDILDLSKEGTGNLEERAEAEI
jgi:hypothetical protein